MGFLGRNNFMGANTFVGNGGMTNGDSVIGGMSNENNVVTPPAPLEAPQLVPGLMAWWDASHQETYTYDGTSGRVKAWASRVNGYVAIQNTTSSMPSYNPGSINGHDAINFDGADDNFWCNEMATAFQGTAVPCTMFTVYRMGNVSGARVTQSLVGPTNNYIHQYQSDGNTYVFTRVEDNGQNGSAAVANIGDTGQAQMVVGRYSGDQLALWKDGTLYAAVGDSGGNLNPTQYAIGSAANNSAFINAVIGEVLIYKSSVQDADRINLQNYLRNKWGTP